MHYMGLIFADESGGYGVTVPDIPGFTAHAEKGGISAAIDTAQRVLTDHVAALVDAGLEVSAARSPDDLKKDSEVKREWDEAAAFVMLRVVVPAGRTLRVNITMDEATLQLVDEAATARKLTRSAFIAEASRRWAVGETEQAAKAAKGIVTARDKVLSNIAAQTEKTALRMEELIGAAAGGSGFARRARRDRGD